MDKEEEKDLYIKAKLKDGHIPERIDNLFNNSINLAENKWGDYMEENNQKPKKNKNQVILKRVAAIAACVVVALGGGNIYATTQGYDNVFFMIKEWINPGTSASGKEEILSDRDITISYKSIEIAKGIKIQINRLVVKDNEAKLYLGVDQSESDLEITPLTYIVRDEDKKEICNYKSIQQGMIYIEELKLEGLKKDATKLELEVKQNNEITLVKFNIDLENKEIQVIGSEYELQKISEEELKKYLSAFALLNYEDDTINIGTVDKEVLKNERNMFVAKEIAKVKDLKFYNGRTTMGMNYYDLIDTEIANCIMSSFTDIELEKDGLVKLCDKYFTKSKVDGKMRYVDMPNPEYTIGGLCIDVTDIKYSNGIYTVTFTYCYPTSQDEIDNKIEDLPVYEMTLGLTINEDQTYSKYRVSSKIGSRLVKPAKTDNNENNEEIIKDNSIKENLLGIWWRTLNVDHEEDFDFSLQFNDDGTFTEATMEKVDETGAKSSKKTGEGTYKIKQEYMWDIVELTYNNGEVHELLYGQKGTVKDDQTKLHYSAGQQIFEKFTYVTGNNEEIIEDNSIRENLLGLWWRTLNVDHEEHFDFSLQFNNDGTFTESTMEKVDETGAKSSKKTGEGTYKIKQEYMWDVVELTYNNGEVHKLLYGQKGTAKDDKTKLHYSAGQQIFEKFTYVTQ